MPTVPEKSAASRGRNAASKPLSGTKTPAASGSKSSRTPSASSTVSSKSSVSGTASSKTKASGKAPARTPSRGSDSEQIKVTKLSSTTVSLTSSQWAPPAPPSKAPPASVPAPPPSVQPQEQPTRTTDPLQVAAQVYPWTYMTSTLDACFKDAEAAATSDLETRGKDLSAEESEIADQRDRLEAERAIQFYDELGSDLFAKEAPTIMQSFHSHGESCAKIETEALKLAARDTSAPYDEEPLKPYNEMLGQLEHLQKEATNLQNSITKLTETPPSSSPTAYAPEPNGDATRNDEPTARTQVVSVFTACLPVLRARTANLSMAQELIDSALENVSLGLRMESMGLTE